MSSTESTAQATVDVARLLERVRAETEEDLAAARQTLARLAEESREEEGSLSDVAAAAHHMVADAERILAEIAAAEGRLEAGTFGRCEQCGSQIPAGRLELRPYVRTCVACAT